MYRRHWGRLLGLLSLPGLKPTLALLLTLLLGGELLRLLLTRLSGLLLLIFKRVFVIILLLLHFPLNCPCLAVSSLGYLNIG